MKRNHTHMHTQKTFKTEKQRHLVRFSDLELNPKEKTSLLSQMLYKHPF